MSTNELRVGFIIAELLQGSFNFDKRLKRTQGVDILNDSVILDFHIFDMNFIDYALHTQPIAY